MSGQTSAEAGEQSRHRDRRLWMRRGWYVIAWLLLVALGQAVMVWQIERFAMRAYRIPSSAMEPTLRCAPPTAGCEGDTHDRVIALRFGSVWTPARGDIVTFDAPPKVERRCFAGGTYVKRIIGLPGERVELRMVRNREYVFIDGQRLHEPYLQPEKRGFGPAARFKVPEGQYFLLGDNRAQSCDSRAFGSVPRSNLVGRVAAVYWPLDRIGSP